MRNLAPQETPPLAELPDATPREESVAGRYKLVVAILIVLAVPIAAFGYLHRSAEDAAVYRFVRVERGDLEAVVSATGTLDAVTTVQVGTQVSGIISEIFVDYNDRVEAGQAVARIDPTLLEIAVREAEADLERIEAQLRDAERDWQRVEELYRDQVVAEVDYHQARYELEAARAAATVAEVGLEKARQNLAYATIYAPIAGTVVERGVDVGQTVAASFSAPELFKIAGDLARMQILASVDESDIGQIAEGQAARFTVQAYPEASFDGTVRQVRLQSTTEENVVNYTVVVDVDNATGKLLPGMTATVDFLVEAAAGVLAVPNAALRFRPTDEMLAALRERRSVERSGQSDARTRQTGERQGEGKATGEAASDVVLLWHLDAEGRPAATPVRTGISDGRSTEIEALKAAIEPGLQVIAGVSSGSSSTSSTNPFQNQQSSNRPGPPGPGF